MFGKNVAAFSNIVDIIAYYVDNIVNTTNKIDNNVAIIVNFSNKIANNVAKIGHPVDKVDNSALNICDCFVGLLKRIEDAVRKSKKLVCNSFIF